MATDDDDGSLVQQVICLNQADVELKQQCAELASRVEKLGGKITEDERRVQELRDMASAALIRWSQLWH